MMNDLGKEIKMCNRRCECHNGTPFDQCECICPYWCGEEK